MIVATCGSLVLAQQKPGQKDPKADAAAQAAAQAQQQ
jgi:hypothetical protein